MNKNILLSLLAIAFLALTSCSGKLGALSADNFNVTPNPLEAQGGQVAATINGSFPEKYMNKKAVVTVIPELRANDGTVIQGTPATFQGEKVLGNDQTISYLLGGHYIMRTDFPYTPALRQSDMYLTFDAKVGKKQVSVPAVKVATGVIATAELYRQCFAQAGACIAPDAFQRINDQKYEANIKFLINQSQLRQSELKNNSVQEFVRLLKKINEENETLNLSNVEIKAYASPEGAKDYNDRLAAQRKAVSEKYVGEQLKNAKLQGNVASDYTAEDWEGFQRLVAASNIQDKDVILRVLSMYKDPEEREQQIRNMSAGFQELADGILPELRRSRIILNYQTIGRDDLQILSQYKDDPSKLSIEELLYAAAMPGTSLDQSKQIYGKAAQLYPQDYRALNNLAAIAIQQDNDALAKDYIQKAIAVNPKAADAQANLAVLALKNGNIPEAESCLSKATAAADYSKALGALNIAKGNYAEAARNFAGKANNLAVLAQILNKDYAGAKSTFALIESSKNVDAITDYLHAINNARLGNKYATNSYLKEAIAKDPALQQFADTDLELKK